MIEGLRWRRMLRSFLQRQETQQVSGGYDHQCGDTGLTGASTEVVVNKSHLSDVADRSMTELRADCTQCAGLCCVALAFDRGESFGFAKAAGQPCRHLQPSYRCAIHAQRFQHGFSGCVSFDCAGAGQLVTGLFANVTGLSPPVMAPAVEGAFRIMRQVQELRQLLHEAAGLPLSADRERRRAELLVPLEPDAGWTVESLADLAIGRCNDDVHKFLRGLTDRLVASTARWRRRLPLLR